MQVYNKEKQKLLQDFIVGAVTQSYNHHGNIMEPMILAVK